MTGMSAVPGGTDGGCAMNVVARVADQPPADRVEYWRTTLSEIFTPLDATPGDAPLRGLLRTAELEGTLLADISGSRQSVRRDRTLIRRCDPEYYKIGMLLDGRGVVLQADRDAVLAPGDLVVWDTSHPYRLEFDETFRMLVLMCPRAALRVPARTMARMTAVRLSSQDGVGALVRPFLTGLAGQLDSVSPAAASHLAAAALEMLAAALSDGDSATPLRGETLLHRVQCFIEDHLSDPDLTPGTVAAAHHISARYLHKLFERNGETVAGWIRTRRLEHCRRDLSAADLSHFPISMIAARWGLHDAARFSKIFRAAYGVSPRQYRHSLVRSTTLT